MFRTATPFLLLALASASFGLKAQDPSRLAALEASLAQNATDVAGLREFCELHFGRAVAGDRLSVEKALEAALALRQLEPANALHPCRMGSLMAMKGRDAGLPLARLWYVQQGLEAMAKAVAQAPEDVQLRLIRAHTCAALPPQFNQLDTAQQDAQTAERLVSAAPRAYPPQLLSQVRALQGRLKGDSPMAQK